MKKNVTVIPGDGIGPEVVGAAMRVAEAAGAEIVWEERDAGKKVFQTGDPTGVPADTVASIQRTRVALKGPLETPVGHGEKSANVTLRKYFETFGNVRPVRELPNIKTPFYGRNIDLTVVRENVEDLYTGIEHLQTPNVAQGLKIMSRLGCERIVRLAFEVARAEGRRSIHCATKANIMKMTEGLLKRTFEAVAPEYPDIEAKHIIVDNCAYQLVRAPESFEVIVTSNMNGDIISDLTSGLVGGLGVAASANIGSEVAIFEAVHGSAPDIAGQNIANPTALMLSTVMLLRHIGEDAAAETMKAALMVSLEDGTFTGDLARSAAAKSTSEFTDIVIANLGRRPSNWKEDKRTAIKVPVLKVPADYVKVASRSVAGADVFVESALTANELGGLVESLVEDLPVKLGMIANRGTRVYPPAPTEVDVVDHWRCRFAMRDGSELGDIVLLTLLQRLSTKLRWNHVEKLNVFDGVAGYTNAQGE